VLVFQRPIPGGRVIISVSDAHLRDVIAGTSENLALVVNKQQLTRAGDVSPLRRRNRRQRLRHQRFPFSMAWQAPVFFDMTRLVQQGWSLMLLVFILSVAVGILWRRYAGKSTSFEEDLRKAIIKGDIVSINRL
jgi:hypothetical protein